MRVSNHVVTESAPRQPASERSPSTTMGPVARRIVSSGPGRGSAAREALAQAGRGRQTAEGGRGAGGGGGGGGGGALWGGGEGSRGAWAWSLGRANPSEGLDRARPRPEGRTTDSNLVALRGCAPRGCHEGGRSPAERWSIGAGRGSAEALRPAPGRQGGLATRQRPARGAVHGQRFRGLAAGPDRSRTQLVTLPRFSGAARGQSHLPPATSGSVRST